MSYAPRVPLGSREGPSLRSRPAAGLAGRPIVGGLDLVFYWVSDLDRAVRFYRDLLGLPLSRREGDDWAEFEASGWRFALHRTGEGQAVEPGGATAVFSVADLDRARMELVAQGVPFEHEGDVQGYARFASCRDPDGNTFQLIEYWTDVTRRHQ